MCKFMSSFPKNTDIIGAPRKNTNLEMFLQPCKDEKTYYRVRLLGFESKDGRRKDPHITRMVHKAWVTDPKTGKKRLQKVICSKQTPWVETEGPKNTSCKICNYSAQQFAIYTESGKSDIQARSNAYTAKPQFEAIVPVYVRIDPNYERNNGKFKVIIFDDKEAYASFRSQINAKLATGAAVFNGVNAVDCLIHVARGTFESKNGKTYAKNVIDKIKFSTEPRDIPAINSKSIDGFMFDSTYLVASDDEEVDAFYNEHCAISNDDIPEDDEIQVYKVEKPQTQVKVPVNEAASNDIPDDDISDDDLDSIVDDKPVNGLEKDPDDEGLDILDEPSEPQFSAPAKSAIDDINSDDLLKDLGL